MTQSGTSGGDDAGELPVPYVDPHAYRAACEERDRLEAEVAFLRDELRSERRQRQDLIDRYESLLRERGYGGAKTPAGGLSGRRKWVKSR